MKTLKLTEAAGQAAFHPGVITIRLELTPCSLLRGDSVILHSNSPTVSASWWIPVCEAKPCGVMMSFPLHSLEGGWGLHMLWKESFASHSQEWSHLIKIKQCVWESSPAIAVASCILQG